MLQAPVMFYFFTQLSGFTKAQTSTECLTGMMLSHWCTFSPKTKNGEGKRTSAFLSQLTDDLCTSADLLSIVNTFRFSLW